MYAYLFFKEADFSSRDIFAYQGIVIYRTSILSIDKSALNQQVWLLF